ncbi:RNA-protein complex protein Nop10 [Candidatus Woesearchaeota archaeon]|nr:RNA-protein complex protein Nop10 [Candidatus Woesearchaeota archaeon]
MTNHILRCKECGKYTLKAKCSCGGDALQPIPAKYSPEDPYGKYRREAKREQLKEAGLL